MRRDEAFTQPDWYPKAPCRTAGLPFDAWFPEHGHDGREAKAVCAACPFRKPCLTGAIERHERAGVWGGVAVGGLHKGRLNVAEVAA